MKKYQKITLALGGLLAATTSYAALNISFDNLSAGNLAGQEGWSGSSIFQVVAGEGVDGSFGLQAQPSAGQTFQDISLFPSAGQLGGTKAAEGLYQFSFDVRQDGPAQAGETFGEVYRIYLTNSTGGPFVAFSDIGTVNLRSNTGYTSGKTQLVQNEWTAIEGILDFDTNTYSVSLDGSSYGAGTFTEGADFGAFTIRMANEAEYIGFTIDNIAIAAVPEPSQAATLAGGLVFLLVWIRRRYLSRAV